MARIISAQLGTVYIWNLHTVEEGRFGSPCVLVRRDPMNRVFEVEFEDGTHVGTLRSFLRRATAADMDRLRGLRWTFEMDADGGVRVVRPARSRVRKAAPRVQPAPSPRPAPART